MSLVWRKSSPLTRRASRGCTCTAEWRWSCRWEVMLALSWAGRKARAGVGAFCIPMVYVLLCCAAGTFTAIANEAAVIKGNDAVVQWVLTVLHFTWLFLYGMISKKKVGGGAGKYWVMPYAGLLEFPQFWQLVPHRITAITASISVSTTWQSEHWGEWAVSVCSQRVNFFLLPKFCGFEFYLDGSLATLFVFTECFLGLTVMGFPPPLIWL